MVVVGLSWGGLETLMRETALFAATGFLILGAGDLLVDLLWLWIGGRGRAERPAQSTAQHEEPAGPDESGAIDPPNMVMFVPAWDEAAVIGPMLRGALAAYAAADFRLYLGCYPNDPATQVAAAALADPRLRIARCPSPGPTTKADCLNALWRALLADEEKGARRADAVVLHDAEDVVHAEEPAVLLRHLGAADLVQLPVLPLIDRHSRHVGGHYADEFAEAHGKELIVRQWLGAAVPSAGVGCAVSRAALDRIAAAAPGGLPFDPASLTEDYELGLRIAEAGGRTRFVRERGADGSLVATRAYFPGTLAAAVRQKSRWVTGIGLAGWDRLGWRGGPAERWMRLRDRQGLLAALLLVCGYASIAFSLLLKLHEAAGGAPAAAFPTGLAWLVKINLALLAWRLFVRAAFTTAAYGPVEGLRSLPRALVANGIAIVAAACALSRYASLRRTGLPVWGKTVHRFPAQAAAP